jgi:multiple sugar transport system substrate-binding protein
MIFPSALWYNRDLFDSAGLAYPPHDYGAPYTTSSGEEMPWNIETLEWLARRLTLDANGRTPDDPGFDSSAVVQYGFDMPWADARGQAVLFGPGALTDSAGNAAVPQHWREFWLWYYDGIWAGRFIPNQQAASSDHLNVGNTFASGRIAMTPQNLWYVCCAGDVDWDVAAMPEYNDVATARLHADTFAITNQTKYPEAAFEVLTWLIGEKAAELSEIYPDDGFLARLSLQDESMASLENRFPAVDFKVFVAGLDHIDMPGHEAGLPNHQMANGRLYEFQTRYLSEAGLDMNAEIDLLLADLQAIFSGAQ